jgi:hypothetical protein
MMSADDDDDGLTYNQRYYRTNREREIARATEYRKKHPEQHKAAVKKRLATPEGKAKRKADALKWAMENPERYAEIRQRASVKHRLKKYGLTSEQFDAMLKSQNNRCAICQSDKVGNKRYRKGAKQTQQNPWPSVAQQGDFLWHVDHDHTNGKVRGLLCHPCNVAIGLMKNNLDILIAAAEYVKKHRST